MQHASASHSLGRDPLVNCFIQMSPRQVVLKGRVRLTVKVHATIALRCFFVAHAYACVVLAAKHVRLHAERACPMVAGHQQGT